MTFSLEHSINHPSPPNGITNRTHERVPFAYHFETFLPARGWTVQECSAQRGGGDMDVWACKKTVTNRQGQTTEVRMMIEINYTDNRTRFYTWDGSDLTSNTTAFFNAVSVPYAFEYNAGNTFRWVASDQSQDSWFWFLGGRVIGFNYDYASVIAGTNSTFFEGGDFRNQPALIAPLATSTTNHCRTYIGGICRFGWTASSLGDQTFIGDSFGCMLNQSFDGFALNTQNDLVVRCTAATSQQTLGTGAADSVQWDGDFYLDLDPTDQTSLMLNTGATDLGSFN